MNISKYYSTLAFIFGIVAIPFASIPLVSFVLCHYHDSWLLFLLLPVLLSFLAILFGYVCIKQKNNQFEGYFGVISGLLNIIIFAIWLLALRGADI